eukprot:CAMPEP_0184688228 /NCGR_PEP_ID=MMETSP0312-20130426/29024_1 /TAXON_ID=31354 /ORGANISM="Compsopogon coeruleus, Strain SAG 36.94" /LENGTH=879 /DNA_ID=CAMNT_0027145123 /DNA_START=229 /DNA_END=2868 /DNA_ORIENTATION=+
MALVLGLTIEQYRGNGEGEGLQRLAEEAWRRIRNLDAIPGVFLPDSLERASMVNLIIQCLPSVERALDELVKSAECGLSNGSSFIAKITNVFLLDGKTRSAEPEIRGGSVESTPLNHHGLHGTPGSRPPFYVLEQKGNEADPTTVSSPNKKARVASNSRVEDRRSFENIPMTRTRSRNHMSAIVNVERVDAVMTGRKQSPQTHQGTPLGAEELELENDSQGSPEIAVHPTLSPGRAGCSPAQRSSEVRNQENGGILTLSSSQRQLQTEIAGRESDSTSVVYPKSFTRITPRPQSTNAQITSPNGDAKDIRGEHAEPLRCLELGDPWSRTGRQDNFSVPYCVTLENRKRENLPFGQHSVDKIQPVLPVQRTTISVDSVESLDKLASKPTEEGDRGSELQTPLNRKFSIGSYNAKHVVAESPRTPPGHIPPLGSKSLPLDREEPGISRRELRSTNTRRVAVNQLISDKGRKSHMEPDWKETPAIEKNEAPGRCTRPEQYTPSTSGARRFPVLRGDAERLRIEPGYPEEDSVSNVLSAISKGLKDQATLVAFEETLISVAGGVLGFEDAMSRLNVVLESYPASKNLLHVFVDEGLEAAIADSKSPGSDEILRNNIEDPLSMIIGDIDSGQRENVTQRLDNITALLVCITRQVDQLAARRGADDLESFPGHSDHRDSMATETKQHLNFENRLRRMEALLNEHREENVQLRKLMEGKLNRMDRRLKEYINTRSNPDPSSIVSSPAAIISNGNVFYPMITEGVEPGSDGTHGQAQPDQHLLTDILVYEQGKKEVFIVNGAENQGLLRVRSLDTGKEFCTKGSQLLIVPPRNGDLVRVLTGPKQGSVGVLLCLCPPLAILRLFEGQIESHLLSVLGPVGRLRLPSS